jgi:pyruvate,orthophosphate dikinase
VILVRRETNPDDLDGMIAAEGILTSRGGKTSHAAVVARGMGKTCVCGAEELEVDTKRRRMTVPGGHVVEEGDLISIDGSSGKVYLGEVPVVPSPVVEYFEGRMHAGAQDADELVEAVHRIMAFADRKRRLRVRANADNAEDAMRARRFGAQGIGLCRTEHMFLGDRRELVERLILADTEAEREESLKELLPLQKQDFVELFSAMDGLPVTVRLLDPPLHEFLPDITELSVRVALAEARQEPHENLLRLLQAVHRLHEQNPMLGLRGVRLGLVIPGLFTMQVRQIAEAAEFFSFGTNDLTQTVWGFSRDDVEASFFTAYLEKGIFGVSPFETIDKDGVGSLVKLAAEAGRATRPDLKLGVCGEHGGDPESVHFFHEVGLDYVSCSPFRIPVARLEAGRAASTSKGSDHR